MTRAVEAVEGDRRAKALELRKLGWTYKEIAERLNYHDANSAWRVIKTELRKRSVDDQAVEIRTLLFERHEQFNRQWTKAALETKDPVAARLYLQNLADTARLTGVNRNEARLAGAAEVSAVAELAAASMLQASLIGVLHEVGLPVETIDLIVGKLNDRLAAASEPERESAADEPERLVIPGETT